MPETRRGFTKSLVNPLAVKNIIDIDVKTPMWVIRFWQKQSFKAYTPIFRLSAVVTTARTGVAVVETEPEPELFIDGLAYSANGERLVTSMVATTSTFR